MPGILSSSLTFSPSLLHSIFCMQGHSTPYDALRQGRETSRGIHQSGGRAKWRRQARKLLMMSPLVCLSVSLFNPAHPKTRGTSSYCKRASTVVPQTADTCSSSSSSSSASCSSAGERARWRPPARCLDPWWAWWESGDWVTMRERCRAVV